MKLAWRAASVQSPPLFHSQVLGASGLAMSLYEDQKTLKLISRARLEHQILAMRLTLIEINKLSIVPPDALIMAVLNLGVQSGDADYTPDPDIHPMSPLAMAQSINAFGRLRLVPAHVRALHLLVTRKGGLGSLKLGG